MPVLDERHLRDRLDGVERRLEALEQRLTALEGAPAAPAPAPPGVAEAPADLERAVAAVDSVAVLTLVGRTFVILAGAYLLRALTESGTLPHGVGLALGLAYAFAWAAMADRAAPRTLLGAAFYGACTVLVGMPLVWEGATRFALLGATASAAMLGGVTAIVLIVAWHRRIEALAWIATFGALAAGVALLFATQAIVAFALLFIALGIATLWLGYDRHWPGPRWPAAIVADAVVLGLAGRALTTPPRDAPEIVLAVQVTLLALYLGSIAVRTLVRGRDVIPFEIAQTSAMLVAGLGGAMYVADESGIAQAGLGTALLVMAATLYAVAFAFIDRQQGRRVNFWFYTSLAVVFVLTGSDLVLKGSLLGVLWAGLAILTGVAARRYGRTALTIHSEAYIAAAALASGLATASLAALFGADSPWPHIAPAGWATLVALGLVVSFTLKPGVDGDPIAARVPGWVLAAFTAVIAGGACTILVVGTLDALTIPMSPGLVATVRTGVIAVAVVAIAWLGRQAATRAFAYLLYPALAWGAVKLVMEDFAASPPKLLFVALGLYGAALILGPRGARGAKAG